MACHLAVAHPRIRDDRKSMAFEPPKATRRLAIAMTLYIQEQRRGRSINWDSGCVSMTPFKMNVAQLQMQEDCVFGMSYKSQRHVCRSQRVPELTLRGGKARARSVAAATLHSK